MHTGIIHQDCRVFGVGGGGSGSNFAGLSVVSTHTGEGLDELQAVLAAMLQAVAPEIVDADAGAGGDAAEVADQRGWSTTGNYGSNAARLAVP